MGGGALTARLKPNRIMVQSLELGPDAIEALKKAAADVALVRTKPSVSAKAAGRLKADIPYRIVDSRQDWVRLRFKGGGGWTSIDRFCKDVCRDLLDVAIYTNDLVALAAGAASRPVPASLSREAEATARQLEKLIWLSKDPRRAQMPEVVAASGAAGPHSAGFANLYAVAEVAAELRRAAQESADFEQIRISPEKLRSIVHHLVGASIEFPADVDIIDNLAVLFAALGDAKRRNLALEIAANLRRR
jgi:hypothetical protein